MVKSLRRLDWFTRFSVLWLSLVAFCALFGRLLPLVDPLFSDFDALYVGLFTPGHFFGTDTNGYDVLANLVVGAQTSIMISLVSVGIGGLIGATLGVISAYRRGRLDNFVNTLFNIFLSIPNLVLGLALVAVLATSSDPSMPVSVGRRTAVIIFSLTIVIIPILGRIARGATLTWVNREFVVAARSMGMKDKDIILRHIVPNVLPAIYAVGFLAIGVVIVAEGALSLLGVGVIDGVSWGAMIARVAGDYEFAPHSLYVPVIVLAFTVISCNQIGDYLRSRLDRREGKI
jgi:peptide/nickel transport system permease protein